MLELTVARRIHAQLILCCILTGCASTYTPQTSRDDNAKFTLLRGATDLGAKSIQLYEAYNDASCTPSSGTGRLAALLTYTSQSKTVQIDAEKHIYVLARTLLFSTSRPHGEDAKNVSYYLNTDSCSNLVSFTPKPSHEYEIKQEATIYSCSVSVLDMADHAAPENLKVEDAHACPVK